MVSILYETPNKSTKEKDALSETEVTSLLSEEPVEDPYATPALYAPA